MTIGGAARLGGIPMRCSRWIKALLLTLLTGAGLPALGGTAAAAGQGLASDSLDDGPHV